MPYLSIYREANRFDVAKVNRSYNAKGLNPKRIRIFSSEMPYLSIHREANRFDAAKGNQSYNAKGLNPKRIRIFSSEMPYLSIYRVANCFDAAKGNRTRASEILFGLSYAGSWHFVGLMLRAIPRRPATIFLS